MTGDADLARIGELLADRTRSRILLALSSGQELSASVLADEAGVSRPTASEHLGKLTAGGMTAVRVEGRHRHYRLASAEVADLLERITLMAPPEPVTSLRDSTRAAQLRVGRTCYDHLAGRLGVSIMTSLLQRGCLSGGDGRYDADRAVRDHPAAYGQDLDYALTSDGTELLDRLGVRLAGGRRRVVRYCVDWTETAHHLAGQLGRGLCDRFFEAGWVSRRGNRRAVRVTETGTITLKREFGVVLEDRSPSS